jgi:16S rRNA (adenine1518-N6/adenine1519-N6)-dimethyltransferase
LGQHFLVDGNVLDIILRTADVRPGDSILEVGPGLGAVTERLLAAGAHVTAVEKDARMFDWLKGRFAGEPRLDLLNQDALQIDWDRLTGVPGGAKAVANLPYGIGSRVLVDWVRAAVPPERIVVTVQMEVGRRLTARPGRKDYGLLTVWTQLRYDADIVKSVSRTCFLPAPAVTSAIVRMDRHDDFRVADETARTLYAITGTAFRHRRKQITTSLPHCAAVDRPAGSSVSAALLGLGLNPRSRPGDLSAGDWRRLAKDLRAGKSVDSSGAAN